MNLNDHACDPVSDDLKQKVAETMERAQSTADRITSKVNATLAESEARDTLLFTPSIEQMALVMPQAKVGGRLDVWYEPLTSAMRLDGITSPIRCAMFIPNVAEETGELRSQEEILDYSAADMLRVWGERFFPDGLAANLAHKPEALANYIYADSTRPQGYRLGNTLPGDGWKYRGRGPTQLTGGDAYRRFFAAIGLDPESDPGLLLTPAYGARASTWHWALTGCNQLADAGDFVGVVRKLNGGTTNLVTRQQYFARAKQAFGVLL